MSCLQLEDPFLNQLEVEEVSHDLSCHNMSWTWHNMSCFVLLVLSGAYGGMSSTGKTEDGQTTQYSGAINEWALVEARLGNKHNNKSIMNQNMQQLLIISIQPNSNLKIVWDYWPLWRTTMSLWWKGQHCWRRILDLQPTMRNWKCYWTWTKMYLIMHTNYFWTYLYHKAIFKVTSFLINKVCRCTDSKQQFCHLVS